MAPRRTRRANGCARAPREACSAFWIVTAKRRASSAARCATRCSVCRSAKSTSRPPPTPPEVIAPRQRGRLQGRADRHRSRHRHRRDRRRAVRGHHAAPGRRDLWPSRQGRASAVTGRRTPSGATSPSMRCRCRETERCTTMSAGLPISSAARALHRRSGAAHRRRLSARPALLPLPRRLWRGVRSIRTGCTPASGANDLAQLSRERVRMEIMKLLVARGASGVLQAMADPGILGLLLGGVPNAVNFTAMAAAETALALPADPMRRLAALAVLVAEDAERLWQKLRLSNDEHIRLCEMAEGWRGMSPALDEQQQKVAALSQRWRALHRPGAACFCALRRQAGRRRPGTSSSRCRSAGRCRHSRSRPPT